MAVKAPSINSSIKVKRGRAVKVEWGGGGVKGEDISMLPSLADDHCLGFIFAISGWEGQGALFD